MKQLLILILLPCIALGQQTGDLNTNNVNSTVNSENPDNSVVNNFNGAGSASRVTPVPTAITPSYIFNGSDSCLIGTGAGVQLDVIGISVGGYKQDNECNRRRDARALNELGMQIAAISRLCQSDENWTAMFKAGTYCPVMVRGTLMVGRQAYFAMRLDPLLLIPNYRQDREFYDAVLGIGVDNEESTNDTRTISERFRTSIR
jgi:hypothetical protein